MRSGFRTWASDVREVMAEDFQHGLLLGAYYAYVGANLTLTSRFPIGTPAFERDWDVLVVLDACRVDALRAVAGEFDFLTDVGSVLSVGSTSGEWMAHTFDSAYREQIERTAMVTANVHSETVLRERNSPPQFVGAPLTWPSWDPVYPDALDQLTEVWSFGWDDELGTVPPRAVTDRAIETGREGAHDRLIVHYLQPHAPHIEKHENGEISTVYEEPLESLRSGDISREAGWNAYLETLRVVLDEVGLLLENLEADRVVLTADHGEAFGEWGFYEHPVCCPHPVVKKVPWVETTATDRQTYDPTPKSEEHTDTGVEEQLSALGYV